MTSLPESRLLATQVPKHLFMTRMSIVKRFSTGFAQLLHYHVLEMGVANGNEEAEPEYNNGCLSNSPASKTDVNPIEYYESRPDDLAPFIPVCSESASVKLLY